MKSNSFLLLAILVFFFISCNKRVSKNSEKPSEIERIDDAILQVKIGDNRTQVGEKLTSQGYKWNDDEKFITVSETFKYNDKYFKKAVFHIFDAKVFFSQVTNKYYDEKEAIDAFEEYNKDLNAKYSKFKTSKTNDVCLKYAQYSDNVTNLSIMLNHNEKQDVPKFLQDEETLKDAKEHWEVTITVDNF